MNGAELAAECYDRRIGVETVMDCATVMLSNLPDEQAQLCVLGWMAKLQNGGADQLAAADTRVPL